MKRVLLISEKQIKDNSIIEQNVDAKILSKTIANVQEVVLKPILGSSVYATLIDEAYNKATDSSYVIAEPYSALLTDYIQPFLINAVLVEFIVVNNYKVTNKGLLKLRDNLADNVDADELEYAKNYHENYLSKYKKNLIDFLKANNLLSCSSDTDITSTSIGWFLGGSKPASTSSSSNVTPVPATEQWLIDKPNYYTKTETDSALNDKSDVGHGHTIGEVSGLQDALDSYIPLSQRAANSGVATLDVGGKVPLSQLPSTLMIYKGTWDALTNSPSLLDGTGTAGWTYRVSVDGSQDLGSGTIAFNSGDYIIYNGTAWEKSDGSDAVTSVNGQQGVVALDYSNVNAPSTTGVGATGTWPISITGNAGTATIASNSTLWKGYDNNFSLGVRNDITPTSIAGFFSDNVAYRFSPEQTKNLLGLSSAVVGTGAVNQVAVFDSNNTLVSSPNFTYNAGHVYIGGRVSSDIGFYVGAYNRTVGLSNTFRIFNAGDAVTANGNSYGFGFRSSDGRFSYTAGNGGFHDFYTNNISRLVINSTAITSTLPFSATSINATTLSAGIVSGNYLQVNNTALSYFQVTPNKTGQLQWSTLTADQTIALPNASGTVMLENTVSGTFTTVDGKTITITKGRVTSIVQNIDS